MLSNDDFTEAELESLGTVLAVTIRGDLLDADTNEKIRKATIREIGESISAACHDGGSGIIAVDGRRCYVV